MLVGVALRRGLVASVDERVAQRLPGIGFDGERHRAITWRHLLQQTSEWEGTVFGLPDTVDRYRHVAHEPRPVQGRKGDARPRHAPGAYWEYNDVRINQLSLPLLHLFGRPLPEVFDEALMRPLGATSAWAWRGDDDAWLELHGRRVQRVPGGTHWGGGLSVGARDQARLAQLLLQGGRWQGERLLPAGFVDAMRTPCPMAPFYGLPVWLNPEGRHFPGASEEAFFMVGAGGHCVWVEPAHDAVVVARWLDGAATAGFMQRVAAALQGTAGVSKP